MPGAMDEKLLVGSKVVLADGVVGLTLRDPSGDELPTWQPGAHVDLELPDGQVRQYSLCGDPADRHEWRIAVLREPAGRGGSEYIHDSLDEGALLTVRGLRNHFPLVESARYLFIAGGIGITPLLPMVAAVESAGADWRLLYGGRARASMAFLSELAVYGDKVVVAPQDEVGLLDIAGWLGEQRTDTRVYCCGPEGLLDAVETIAAGWPAGSLQVERFHPTDESAAPGTGFEVELAGSGLTLQVPPDKSVLDVLEEAGVEVLWSCREGTCGTCETGVLEGVPDHRDSLLTKAERETTTDYMYVCVSRARTSRLVLEL
jgi:ferredoxin-NADP reductase